MRWQPARYGVLVGLLASWSALRAENRLWSEPESGEPGESVAIVVRATTDEAIRYVDLLLRFDTEALLFLERDFSSSPAAQIAESVGGAEDLERGLVSARIYVDYTAPYDRSFPPTVGWEVVRFRFQIRSETPAGDYQAGVVATGDGTREETALVSVGGMVLETEIVSGTVTVTDPTRPAPPRGLTCVQELRNVRLTWATPLVYNLITIMRNGAVLDVISGTAESYSDENPPQGRCSYEVFGVSHRVATVPVECVVDVGPPVVEPVQDLSCRLEDDGVELTWTPARAYSAIEVKRNGETVSTLAGDAVAYRDTGIPDGAILYEVRAYIREHTSPGSTCTVRGTWVTRIDSIFIEPEKRDVLLPVYISNPFPITAFEIGVVADPAKVRITGVELEDTVGGRLPDFSLHEVIKEDFSVFAPLFCNANGCWTVPAGIDSCFMKISATVAPAVREGDVIPLTLTDGLQVSDNVLDNLFVDDAGAVMRPELVSGEIVVGQAAVKAVGNLRAAKGSGDARNVDITWRNRGPYDSIQVERNGAIIAELPSQTERVTDEIEGAGAYWYRVRGIAQNVPSPWSLVIHTDFGVVPLFKRGDANADGAVNVGDAVSICAQLFRGALISCEDACDTNDDGRLNVADPVFLLGYLFLRAEPPPSPGPRVRWYDTTPDGLGCETGTP